MIQAIFGKKVEQSQRFLENGVRVPVTTVIVSGNIVVAERNQEKHGYAALELGIGTKKKATKALLGHVKKAKLKKVPQFLREVRVDSLIDLPAVGEVILAGAVLKSGDIVDVCGISKGKGYAGVVKRHHFKGGPRTHGQSDRERAPGSIGQTTTPGRVYKGKRMAGRMGNETVTIKNLKVLDVTGDVVLLAGLVPGHKNSLIRIKKVAEMKKFVPLHKDEQPKEQKVSARENESALREVKEEKAS